MHPAGKAAYVMHKEAIVCHSYDSSIGKFSGDPRRLSYAGVAGPAAMTVHPSGSFLYACERGGGIRTWNLSDSGTIRRSLGVQAGELGELRGLHIAPDGRSIVAINRNNGTIQQAAIDPGTGTLSSAKVLTRVDSPASLVVLYS
jgi:6-phosphogluconolactonase (cycloisomerase 2 family)